MRTFLILSSDGMVAALVRWFQPAACLAAVLAAPCAPAAADDGAGAEIRRLVDAGAHPWLGGSFAAEQPAVQRVYDANRFAPLWTRDCRPTAQAATVLATTAGAGTRGLSPADYGAERLRAEAERLATAPPGDEACGRFDVALTIALMRYASDAYLGRVDPHAVGFAYDVEPKRLDLAAVVDDVARHPDAAIRLDGLDPPLPAFARLRAALARYRDLAVRPDLPPMPAIATLRPGDLSADLPSLRAWLEAYGDQPADAVAADPLVYDPALADAVRRFQNRHGLEPDAIIGRNTARTLLVPAAARGHQIELAMERLRWLPAAFPDRFLVVNIPEFRLRGFAADDGAAPLTMNVVVGESARPHMTPVLHADMTYVVFRPYWYVPTSIARREIFPKAERDPGYLARNDMEVSDGRVRQRPGRHNSLGLVKFIFPNPHHVYLHDTPAKALFARSRRDFSHGCIRVADPRALAEFVLAGQNGWDRSRIDRAMTEGADNRRVNLDQPVPVYLVYATAVVEADGTVHFFDDIYGHDARLAKLLAAGRPYPHRESGPG